MFGRFTEQAREVVTFAQTEARELGFGHVGSEALLLGLLREQEGFAARVLESFDVTLELARAEVLKRVGAGERLPESAEIPFTPRAEELFERALREALSLGHNYVGTEHILLAMASVGEGEGMNALRARGVDSIMIRDEVIKLLQGPRTGGASKALKPVRRWPSGGGRASPRSDGFWVNQDPDVARVMKRAAARALDDGRTEIAARDLLIALSRDPSIGPRLAEAGANEAAIREAFDRPIDCEPPSDAPGPS
jgi:ATP-dependent Clp protease ATP-binding subunit ClpC